MLEDARYLKQQQATLAEVKALVNAFHDRSKITHVLACLDELADYASDVAIVDGDLTVDGDLDMLQERLFLLIVKGSLKVSGCVRDYDDPESFIVVHNDVDARAVITAGWLEVHGALRARAAVLGDYNDCAAWVDGDVVTPLFYGEEHHFSIGGALQAPVVLGRPRLKIAHAPEAIPLHDARVLLHVDRELLRTLDDEDDDGKPVVSVDGLKDFGAFKRRVAAGQPLRSPDADPP